MAKKIPDLPESELSTRFARVRPLMRFSESENGLVPSECGELRFVLVESPYENFTENPRAGNPAKRIRKMTELKTYHYWPSLLPVVKPTCAEILGQIPLDILNRAVGFEVETDVDQGNIEGNFLCTVTVIYERCKNS